MSSPFLDAALTYASYGIPVMPLRVRDKIPTLKDWVHKASTDPEQIKKWWTKSPQANIGGVMGDIVCLDFDVDEGYDSREYLYEWEEKHGKLPETATAITGRGGWHYYYRVDREIHKSENANLHIDIRAIGAQAVLPPSIHPNGNEYYWDLDPAEYGFADADENVYAFIASVQPAQQDDKPDTTIPSDKVHEGEGRNSFLFKQGRSIRAKGADDETVAIYLQSLNQTKCQPPLPEQELWKTIGSVCTVKPGMSDEVKSELATKKSNKKPKFKHNEIAYRLIKERGACLIDGVTPAIRLDGGHYRLGWDAFDVAIIDMYEECTNNNRNETKAYIKAIAPHRGQSAWNLIAFNNGVLDILTMELREWRDDDVILNVIPHNWNPDADCTLLLSTLEKMACGDTATLLNLQEFIGICMLRSNTRMPFYPVLIGTGSNGKSTYIKLLKDVLGAENCSALQPAEIGAHFMGEHIVGKIANLGDDIANAYLDGHDCGIIKRISTGENIFTDVKGTKGYYFEPYCTMVFSCNAFPRCADTSDGFMRRLFPIEFNARFSPDNEDYDPLITEKMRAEEVLEAACVAGVSGLVRTIAQNQPTPNRMSVEVKKGIAAESNTGLQWFADAEIKREDIIGKTKDEVYQEYVEWCERNGYGRTAMASGTLSALIGTYWHLKCVKSDHRTYTTGRKTVKVYAEKVP